MLISAVALMALAARLDVAVKLERKYSTGTVLKYSFKSHLLGETYETGDPTGIPDELDVLYKFTTKVTDAQSSGFATIDYVRPTVTEVQGETAERPPVSNDIPVNFHYTLQVSPINEVTDVKDLNAGKKDASGKKKGGVMATTPLGAVKYQGLNLPFLQEMERMALLVSNPVDGLDFSPKLPLQAVMVGDTWKRTVSYQPQTLAGSKEGKQAIQRVDMVYTYLGSKMAGGQEVVAIKAEVDLDTDATNYIAEAMGVNKAQSPVKSMQLKLKTTLNFNLDPQDLHTISATGHTSGAYDLILTRNGETGHLQRKLTANTSLTLTP